MLLSGRPQTAPGYDTARSCAMSEFNDLIVAYSKNPPNRGEIEGATVEHLEESRVCADVLKVWMKISPDGVVQEWVFDGKTSLVTTACAAVFGESIVGKLVSEILPLQYFYVRDLLGMDVTPKRHHAASLPVLATRNALHKWLQDGKVDDFSDVLP